MEDFLIYLVKSSGILGLFWCCFKLFLEKETLFTLHRVFLISGIAMALIFPIWTLTEIILVDPLPFTLTESPIMESTPISATTLNWWNIIAILYACGVLLFLGRLGIQLLSLRRLIKQGTIINDKGFIFIESNAETSPFSFFNLIVYNPAMHRTDELEKIIAHEKIHALQWHSFDILLIQLFSAFQWVNPFVWLYKKSLTQNLEYIADHCATKNMENSKEYQYLLLKNSSAEQQYSSIINPFYTSSIKKRIVMLNKNRSNKFKAWKFSLIIPCLAFFLLAFNTKTVTRINTLGKVQESSMENNSTDTTKVEFTIDKNTSDENLEKITSTLKSVYNISQSFTDIKRNQIGVIINISSSFTVSKADNSTMTGTNTFNHQSGIKPFSLYVETDKDDKIISISHGSDQYDNLDGLKTYQQNRKTNPGLETIHIKASPTTNNSVSTDPMIIIDAIEVTKDSIASEVDSMNIPSINVVKKAAATNKYGENEGTVEITTKRYHNAQEADKPTTQIPEYTYIKSKKEPLFIIDGVEKDADFNFGTIPPSSIETMKIFKGEEANNKYGKKGEKNGVVVITTKKSEWKVQSGNNNSDPQSNGNLNGNTPGSVESIEVIKHEGETTPISKWKVGYSINMNDPDDIYDLSPFRQNGMEKAVIYVNGVNKGKNYVPTMKYSEVERTGTYRPSAETTKKYGKMGKNGVIEITTKKN